MGYSCKTFAIEIASFTRTLIIIWTPLILLPMLIIVPNKESYCGYVLLLMAVFWMTEAVPLPVTSLLPLVLFPYFGIMRSRDVCMLYTTDTCMMILGALMEAAAVEKWNLHQRIALATLNLIGSKPRWLILGFMAVTAFLSMWIVNTASAAMMMPIAFAVMYQLAEKKGPSEQEIVPEWRPEPEDDTHTTTSNGATVNKNVVMDTTTDNDEWTCKDDDILTPDQKELKTSNINADQKEGIITESYLEDDEHVENMKELNQEGVEIPDEYRMMAIALCLSVAYSANIGGSATLIGTSTNMVMIGILEQNYGTDHGVTFGRWMLFVLPSAMIFLAIMWIWFLFFYLDLNPKNWKSLSCKCETTEDEVIIKNTLKAEYAKLGPWSWAEITIAFHFTMICILWLTRDALWGQLFPDEYVSDTTVVMLGIVVLFILPAYDPGFLCCKRYDDDTPRGTTVAILDWPTLHTKVQWGVVVLIGGAYALAGGSEESGLSAWIANQLEVLGELPVNAIVLISVIIVGIFTEITSNSAVAAIFLPILAALAEELCINPLYLLIPATIVCSYAFMLPAATPPNAVAFGCGLFAATEMMRCGTFLKLLGMFYVTAWVILVGVPYWDLNTYPDWADDSMCDNTTIYA